MSGAVYPKTATAAFAQPPSLRRRSRLATHATRWISPAARARSGGDWCEIVARSDDLLALSVGDVCGHGESASATMNVLRTTICAELRAGRRPSASVSVANGVACAQGEIIITAVVASIDRQRRTLTFASAGHPASFLTAAGGGTSLGRSPADLPLGLVAIQRFAEYTPPLPDDALITFYTDGLTEHGAISCSGRALAPACRYVCARSDGDPVRAIAKRVFRHGRGDDNAALITVRIRQSVRGLVSRQLACGHDRGHRRDA